MGTQYIVSNVGIRHHDTVCARASNIYLHLWGERYIAFVGTEYTAFVGTIYQSFGVYDIYIVCRGNLYDYLW